MVTGRERDELVISDLLVCAFFSIKVKQVLSADNCCQSIDKPTNGLLGFTVHALGYNVKYKRDLIN